MDTEDVKNLQKNIDNPFKNIILLRKSNIYHFNIKTCIGHLN
jgi:hypothetical protein